MAQHRRNTVIDLGLLPVLRLADVPQLLLFFFPLAEKLAADNLFGRSLFKRVLPKPEPHNPFEAGQPFVMFLYNLGNHALNILDARHLGVLVIGVNFRRNGIILAKHQDFRYQPVVFKQVFQLFRRHVFPVA